MPSKALQITCVAMLAAQVATLAASDPGELTLTVPVYDYTGVPAVVLENAMAVAQRIFHDAGIATRWVQCGAAHESRRRSGCLEVLGTAHLFLRIVRSDWQGSGGRPGRMGFALHDAEGRLGIYAYVFQQGVEGAIQFGGCGRLQVLGYAMAHEVGHLLLGGESHSATGIMQPHWDASQMVRKLGAVTFTSEQARRIQVNVATRILAEQQSGPAQPATAP